jgi:Tol biopolymer transport system component
VNANSYWRNSANVSNASIWILDANGGEPVPVTDEEHMNVSPQWLPDSRHLLFVSDRDGPRGIYVVEVGPEGPRGSPRSVLSSSDPHSISISADGRRLAYSKFTVAQNIWSVPIPRSGSVSIGDAVPVTTGNQVIETHALSPDGKDGSEIAFYSGGWEGTGSGAEVRVVSADGGTPEQLTDFLGSENRPDWSPDGLAIAFNSQGPQGVGSINVWTVSRDSVGMPWSYPVQLTDFRCGGANWAPDGASLACYAGGPMWVRVSRDGEILSRYDASTLGLQTIGYLKFSPDGSRVYFLATHPDGSEGVWWIPANGGDATKVVAFDDPSLTVFNAITVGPEDLYLTISEYESDIWVMDLEW